MYQRFFVFAVLCFAFQTTVAIGDDMVSRIVNYFPGEWENKLEDGTLLVSVNWSAVAGGKSIAGPGKSKEGSTFALAGWDPEKKIWRHVWHGEDGTFGRLELERFEGDTYYGEGRVIEGDGSVVEFQLENRIIDKNHFVLTQRVGGEVAVSHWHRKKK